MAEQPAPEDGPDPRRGRADQREDGAGRFSPGRNSTSPWAQPPPEASMLGIARIEKQGQAPSVERGRLHKEGRPGNATEEGPRAMRPRLWHLFGRAETAVQRLGVGRSGVGWGRREPRTGEGRQAGTPSAVCRKWETGTISANRVPVRCHRGGTGSLSAPLIDVGLAKSRRRRSFLSTNGRARLCLRGKGRGQGWYPGRVMPSLGGRDAPCSVTSLHCRACLARPGCWLEGRKS